MVSATSNNHNFIFRLLLSSISILFVLHFFNDLDIDSQYFLNIYAAELNANDNNNNDRKERIDFSYTVDSSEYFEEDNIPQNNNNNNINNNYNNNRNFSPLTQQQQSEVGQQDYNQMKKEGKEVSSQSNNNNNKDKKYEFTSIETKENTNNNFNNSDYVTFKVVLNLQNIEKTGFIRLVGYINGQSFKEDIQLSELDLSTNKLDVKLNVLKDIGFVSLDPPDEFFVCAYHLKDLEKEKNSLLQFDCNEADVQSSDGPNTIRLFKPSSMKYSGSKAFNEQQVLPPKPQQQLQQQQDSK